MSHSPTSTTKKIRRWSTFSGGLEGTLDVVAKVVLVLAVLHAVVVSVASDGRALPGVPGLLMAAVVSWVTLRALAEILRLLKKAAGLPYGGRITEAVERQEELAICTQCGAILHSERRCESCGRDIVAG